MSFKICNECKKEVGVGEGVYFIGTFHHYGCLDVHSPSSRPKPKKEHNVKEANYEDI